MTTKGFVDISIRLTQYVVFNIDRVAVGSQIQGRVLHRGADLLQACCCRTVTGGQIPEQQRQHHDGARPRQGQPAAVERQHKSDAQKHTGNGTGQDGQEVQKLVEAYLLLLYDVGQDHGQQRGA